MTSILVHAIGATMGGAERHLRNFLPALAAEDRRRHYHVLVRDSLVLPVNCENIVIERVADADAGRWLVRATSDLVKLPWRLRRNEFAAVISLTNFGPIWSPVPHILFQRNPIYFCRDYLNRINTRAAAEVLMRRRLSLAAMKRAKVIVTPSDAMAELIRKFYPETSALSFFTLHHGFDTSGFNDPLHSAVANEIDSRSGLKFLYPTHPAPHKGFDVLFEALALLKAKGLHFCLFTTIAESDWPVEVAGYRRQIECLGLQDHVVFLGRTPQRQMGALYKRCDLMIYPSLCESFGFSMIEAMGHGLPIVAADTSINREMCQNGALYYDRMNATAAAAAISQALLPEANSALRSSGAARVSSFDWSWARYAREFVQLIESVL